MLALKIIGVIAAIAVIFAVIYALYQIYKPKPYQPLPDDSKQEWVWRGKRMTQWLYSRDCKILGRNVCVCVTLGKRKLKVSELTKYQVLTQ